MTTPMPISTAGAILCDVDLARAIPFGSAAGPVLHGCLMSEKGRQFFQLNHIAGSYR
jgi:hypothetical protein